MKIFFNWFISALAIIITAYILPGVSVEGVVSALVLAVVLGAINTFIRPVLTVLTLPLTIFTLGIFAIVLNTILIMIAGAIVPGVSIDGFWWALLFGLVLTLVHGVFKKFEEKK